MTTADSPATSYRKAPGQRGGLEWRGPRERLTTRVDPTSAALLRLRARAAGMTTSDYLAGLVGREVTHQ